MQTKEPAQKPPANVWTCPFCQQKIRIGAYGFCPSEDFRKHCLLPAHIVDDECVAYRDSGKARELLMDRD
jgi:hypothetical protein